MLKGLDEAINASRDPKKLEAEKKAEMAKKQEKQRSIREIMDPIVSMVFRDSALAKDIAVNNAREERKSEKAKETSKEKSIESKEGIQRSEKLDSKTQDLLLEGERLSASKDGETFDFDY